MKAFTIASALEVLAFVAMSGSIASAGLPPTVVWQDNFTGANGTALTSLSPPWLTVPGTNTLTSYVLEDYFAPPVAARTWGMGGSGVYALYQPVSGMDSHTSQWFHFKGHKANGVSTTMYDEVRVQTNNNVVLLFRIAEAQAMAAGEVGGVRTDSGNLGDQLSLSAWREFDIKYNNAAGSQVVTYYINSSSVWSKTITSPGYITQVQFVQQGGAKTGPPSGDSHLIGEMAVGTADLNCTPPAAPTGIAVSPATICSGSSSTLSVNDPGAGLTTDWFTGTCGGTLVAGGTGVNSVIVSPISTMTYYARTRDVAEGCVSTTCQSVTVTVPVCDDGNTCTTDACSDGVCSHTSVANGTACEDGNPCTENDTCQNGTCESGTPIEPCDTSNGFDPNRILVLRGGSCESDVRILDETRLDSPGPYVDGMDLGAFGPPKVISTPYKDGIGTRDSSRIKSLCFSNSPVAGQYTPAGTRLFGLYEVRSAEGPMGPVENEPPEYDWTNYSSSFQIVELDSTGNRIRVMAVGLAASLFHDLPAPFDICNNHSPDLLIAPWCSNDQWGTETRHNDKAGVRIGNIRYNRAKNTLMVAALVGEWEIYRHDSPVTGEPAYPRGRVYEFELPDWPEAYYETEDDVPYYCVNKAEMVGEPIPVSDPAVVRLVQIYEMPGSVSANNGQTQNDNTRPSIDIDGQGDVYFTSPFYNATNPPNWGTTSLGTCWNGEGLWHGDVVKFNSLGHRAGRDVYVVPVIGEDACNLVIAAQNQDAMGHTEYASGHGLAVRPGNQLVTVPRITCNDPAVDPDFKYVNIFDLTQTEGGAYPCELKRLKYLGNDRCDLPRTAYFAQRDDVSGRVYMANLMGACDCAQNFMCIQNDYPIDTVAHDLGYHLLSSCLTGNCIGHYEQGLGCELKTTWDAASPPGPPTPQYGACCNASEHTCTDNVSQIACYQAGGLWLGNGTTCAQYPCPGQGACCKPCGQGCDITYEGECTGWDRTWHGAGTSCGDVTCEVCSPQPMDADCDGDVDQSDFSAFQLCYTGPGVTFPVDPLTCACFDRGADAPEGDGDIDPFDLDAFEACASGPAIPANPACLP